VVVVVGVVCLLVVWVRGSYDTVGATGGAWGLVARLGGSVGPRFWWTPFVGESGIRRSTGLFLTDDSQHPNQRSSEEKNQSFTCLPFQKVTF